MNRSNRSSISSVSLPLSHDEKKSIQKCLSNSGLNIKERLLWFKGFLKFFWYRLLKFQIEPLENTFKKVIFCFLSISMITSMFLGGLFSNDFQMSIMMLCISGGFIINSIMFFILKNYDRLNGVFLFVYSCCFNVIFILISIFGNAKGIIYNVLFVFFLIVPLMNILLDGLAVFWIMFFWVLFVIGFIFDMVCKFPMPESFFDEVLKAEIIIKYYVIYGLVCAVIIITAMYYKIVISMERKLVLKISKSIAELEVTSDMIKKIKKQKSYSKSVDYLKSVIDNMKDYISFLPQTLKNNEILPKKEVSNPRNSLHSFFSTLSSNHTDISSTHSAENNARKNVYIDERIVTVLKIHIVMNFFSLSKNDVKYFFDFFFELVIPNSKKKGGVVYNFNHDCCYVCWNADSISLNSLLKAAELVFIITSKWKTLEKEKFIKFIPKLQFSLKEFKGWCGNFGNEEFRRFNISGQGMEELNYMCELNHKFNTSFIVDQDVSNKLKFKYNLKQINFIPERNLDVFEVINPIKKEKEGEEQNEWLYEIKHYLITDTDVVAYQDAWKSFKNGEYEKSLKEIDKIKDQEDKYVKNLKNLIKMKKAV